MIYCVEDERNIRELIVYTLESSGFTARGLESGKELNAAIAEQLNVCIDAFCYHRSCRFRHILQTDACIRHTKTRYFYDIRNIRCLVSDPLHIGNHF